VRQDEVLAGIQSTDATVKSNEWLKLIGILAIDRDLDGYSLADAKGWLANEMKPARRKHRVMGLNLEVGASKGSLWGEEFARLIRVNREDISFRSRYGESGALEDGFGYPSDRNVSFASGARKSHHRISCAACEGNGQSCRDQLSKDRFHKDFSPTSCDHGKGKGQTSRRTIPGAASNQVTVRNSYFLSGESADTPVLAWETCQSRRAYGGTSPCESAFEGWSNSVKSLRAMAARVGLILGDQPMSTSPWASMSYRNRFAASV